MIVKRTAATLPGAMTPLAVLVGLVAAALVLLVIGNRVGALGSDLLGSAQLPVLSWAILVALPVFGVVLATIVARATILRALGRML